MRRLTLAMLLSATVLLPSPALADHDEYERSRCYDYECDDYGRGGDGGYSEGHQGYGGGGGRSGDMEQGDGSCRNFCNWTIPGDMFPGGGEGEGGQPEGR